MVTRWPSASRIETRARLVGGNFSIMTRPMRGSRPRSRVPIKLLNRVTKIVRADDVVTLKHRPRSWPVSCIATRRARPHGTRLRTAVRRKSCGIRLGHRRRSRALRQATGHVVASKCACRPSVHGVAEDLTDHNTLRLERRRHLPLIRPRSCRSAAVNGKARPRPFLVVPASSRISPAGIHCRHSSGKISLGVRHPVIEAKVAIPRMRRGR